MEIYGMIDPWRELHQDTKRFTYHHQGSNPRKMSRLDFFLVSHSLFPYVTKAGIQAGVQSDHSFITLQVDFNKFTRGRGYWKLNNSLLKDSAYREVVKKCFKNNTFQYSADPNITWENIEP